MNEEEPAWRAELNRAMDERFPLVRNEVTRDAIRVFVAEQIQAAEQRGREAALREAAKELEAVATSLAARAKRDPLAFVKGASDARYHSALCWNAAARRVLELIDPDKP